MTVILKPAAESGVPFIEAAPGARSIKAAPLFGGGVLQYSDSVYQLHQTTRLIHSLGCYVFRDVILSGRGIMSYQGALISGPEVLVSYFQDKIAKEEFRDLDELPIVDYSEDCLVVLTHGITNYGHWLADVLPRLYICREALGIPLFEKLLVPLPVDEVQDSIIKIVKLCFPNIRLFPFNSKGVRLRLRRCYIPTLCHMNYCFHPRMEDYIHQMKQAALTSVKTKHFDDRPLFFSRRSAPPLRRLVNRGEIEELARSSGFQIYHPTESWGDQVQRYSRAPIILGEYGSGLHNSMFSQKGIIVVGLNPITNLQSWLGALNQERTGYLYPINVKQIDPYRMTYEVALSDVEKAINLSLREAGNA